MSRRNNLKKRRQQHAAMLADERARETVLKKRLQRRLARKEKSAADRELAIAVEKIVTVGESEAKSVPRIGAPLPADDDVKMGLSRQSGGRIRKKKKKDLERSRKIRKRMLERGAMMM